MSQTHFQLEFKTGLYLLPQLPGMYYLEVPAEIVKQMGAGFSIRLVCTVNGRLSFQCGLVALGGGAAYITITKKRMKELGLREADEVNLRLVPDTSEYGMEVPEELSELLRQDEEGKRRFQNLSAGKQRYIIQYVSTVKSSSLRLERALLLIGNLKKLPPGKESFRAMLGLPERD